MDRIESFFKNKFFIYLFFFILVCLMLLHYNKIYLNCSIEGDFGRDLYNFYLVSTGKMPFIDFNWIYGPLSPLLFGLNFKLFGVSIATATNLYYIILLCSSILLFYFVQKLTNTFFAFLVSTGFILYYSFFILLFNHVVGIIPILVILYSTYLYLKNGYNKHLIIIGAASIFLCLVKLNMALAIIVPVYIILFYHINKQRVSLKPLIYSFLVMFCVVGMVYLYFIVNTPFDQISKCFPYLPGQRLSQTKSFIDLLFTNESHLYSFSTGINEQLSLFVYFITVPAWHFIVIILGFLFILFIHRTKNIESADKSLFLVLFFLSITTIHEYIIAGTVYSLRYWSLLIDLIFVFLAIHTLLKIECIKNSVKKGLVIFTKCYFLILIVLFICSTMYYTSPGKCYSSNARINVCFSGGSWPEYFSSVVNYINRNVPSREYLFVLPYNILYNFVTERKYPSRYTEFMAMSGITIKDEYKVISDLETYRVKNIIYFSKAGEVSGGYGIIGKTHCKILVEYISNNYAIESVLYNTQQNSELIPIVLLKRKTYFRDMKKGSH